MELTHIDDNGNAIMVDVGDKTATRRTAIASGCISMSRECYQMIREGRAKKGDVLGVAQVAGIMGTKRTPDLIPLCHRINLTHSKVEFVLDDAACSVTAVCTAQCTGQTGVEMEALTGVSAALLTIYDMCKAADRGMILSDIHLVEKMGGKSGHFTFGDDHA